MREKGMRGEVVLYTDLPVAECVRRLSASGWAGEVSPDRWQPTATDRDMFRLINGHQFWLVTRDVHLAPGSARALGARFHGTLVPAGRGTRIAGDDGRRPGRPLLLLAVLVGGTLLLQLTGMLTSGTGGAAPADPLPINPTTVAVFLTLAGFLLALTRVVSRWSPDSPQAHFISFLEQVLEARPPDG